MLTVGWCNSQKTSRHPVIKELTGLVLFFIGLFFSFFRVPKTKPQVRVV